MGVTGLWTVLQPCARPIKIETLNKKRLAVDASIWIYQFLKAVRDKEGNALRNSHIVGFFRRICKLLFFGIKPVFVFDGGAPALKRQTITSRKSRREGRREDAVRTAGKLLAVQMQRVAEEEEKKRKEAARHPVQEPEEDIPENVVYADEILQTDQQRAQNRKFRKKDQYHLPELGMSLSEMGGQNDPRVMSLEELEDYARQFDTGEDINVYDFSKIDFDSPFFVSLPASDRYNILNAARLRSRLRMGYSKDQLDTMFPDRMAFSKFQIERVRERNELTQRLMNINGMNDDLMLGPNGANRVAGEKGREYVLVKNDGVEGGWALGVVTNKDEGKAEKPIDVDLPPPPADDEEWEDDDEFEDVPVEGLNRLPKPKPGLTAEAKEGREFISQELAKRRQKFYDSRKDKPHKSKMRKASPANQDPNSLFLAEDEGYGDWENVPIDGKDDLSEESGDKEVDDEEQQLQQAIALSMHQDGEEQEQEQIEESNEDVVREVFQQERAKEVNPFSQAKGSGIAIARMANQRSSKLAPKGPFEGGDSESESDDMDLQAALAESRRSKHQPAANRPAANPSTNSQPVASRPTPKPKNALGFDGPLPFEKLNLGNSLLGKKKMQRIEEDTAGGFEKDLGTERKKSAEPLPPWFMGERNIQQEMSAQREDEKREWERSRKEHEEQFQFDGISRLRRQSVREVIDLEAPGQEKIKEVLAIDSENEHDEIMEDVPIEDPKLRMGDIADKIRAEPPQQDEALTEKPPAHESDDELVEWSESEPEDERRAQMQSRNKTQKTPVAEHPKTFEIESEQMQTDKAPTSEEAKPPSPEFEDMPMAIEAATPQETNSPSPEFENVPIQNEVAPQQAKSPSPAFEDVPIVNERSARPRRQPSPGILQGPDDLEVPIVPATGIADDTAPLELADNDSDQYSDPEDAELFASLAAEAQEHSRFAQELNNNTTAPINFDEELKQLRAQQKKDRRDADEVTQTMISECQHLLTLFGLPYITAPMEAEAQCAALVHLGLVDGIVTDDSDTFLFGGTRVYKNMFNAAKFVECYLANDLTSEFSLTREKLISISQLLGSDYTTGIPGIGPVTALEILSEFPDLQQFKDWWSAVQNNAIPKEADKKSQFRRRFRRSQSTKLFLPPNFPDPRVADAYLHPEVDTDPEPFQWGVPDLAALRAYLSSQIGWSSERTDEVLVPVIKDMNRREKEGTQANITRFFEGSVGAGAFAPRVRDGGAGGSGSGGPSGKKKGKGAAGKRLGAALSKLAERERRDVEGWEQGEGEGVEVEADNREREGDAVEAGAELEPEPTRGGAGAGKRKRAGGKKKPTSLATANEDDTGVDGTEDDEDDDLYAEPPPPKKKQARKTTKNKGKSAAS